MEYRTGIGYDVHAFAEGRKLILGGVEIPHNKGLLGHSDADVLMHALMDALLGAAGSGDIGEHFPDTDERYKGASSLELLRVVSGIVGKAGFVVRNVDMVLLAEAPKIKPHKDAMLRGIAEALDIDGSLVNIKATTSEGLGFVGEKKGMAAYATALLGRKE